MSKKKKQQLTVMVGLLVCMSILLLAVVLITRYHSKQQEQKADAAIPRVMSMEGVTGITLTHANGEEWSFTKTEDGWTWAEDADFPLDDSNLTSLENMVKDYQAEREVEQADSLEAYGLDEPQGSVTFQKVEDSVTLTLGDTASDGNQYVRNEATGTLYTVDDTLSGLTEKGLYDMANLPNDPAFSSDIVKTVTLQGKKTINFTVQPVEVEQETEGDASASATETETTTEYHYFLNGKDQTGTDSMTAFQTELDSLSIEGMAAWKPTDAERKAFGLNQPQLVLTVTYSENDEEKQYILTVGSENGNGDYYCTLNSDSNAIYLIKTDSLTDTFALLSE